MMMHQRCRRDRGVILGVVLVLLLAVIGASTFALLGLRSDNGAAGRDRLERQLLDCAEQGLAAGKRFFVTTGRAQWSQFLSADVCSAQPTFCKDMGGPFQNGLTGTVSGYDYPNGAPFTAAPTSSTDSQVLADFRYTFALYQPQGILPTTRVMVYSRCIDTRSQQVRAVQSLIEASSVNGDYSGQAGHGFRNPGNMN